MSFDTYMDTQRLKETFFSVPQEQTPAKKNFFLPLIYVIAALILSAGAFVFFSNYDLIIIARDNIALEENSYSLLDDKVLSSLKFMGREKGVIKQKSSSIYLSLPLQRKTGLKINLAKPVDLNKNNFYIYLKKSDIPLELTVITKDNRFFSNALKPLVVPVNQTGKSSYLKIPVKFEDEVFQRINLAKIKQIKLFFTVPKEKLSKSDLIAREDWILIKDIVLSQKTI